MPVITPALSLVIQAADYALRHRAADLAYRTASVMRAWIQPPFDDVLNNAAYPPRYEVAYSVVDLLAEAPLEHLVPHGFVGVPAKLCHGLHPATLAVIESTSSFSSFVDAGRQVVSPSF